MFSQSKNHLSSKLARCWRGSWYGLGFAASAVFLIVMIWILWCYLGFSSLQTVEPQRRAIVDYGTTTSKSLDVTHSTPVAVFLQKNASSNGQTNTSPLRGNSRGEAQQGLDKRKEYPSARTGDGLPKGDFDTRDKFSGADNSSAMQPRSGDDTGVPKSKSSTIIISSERPTERGTRPDDRAIPAPRDDSESTAGRIKPTSARSSGLDDRSLIDDRRSPVETSRRVDEIDIRDSSERSRRPVDINERRPIRDDDTYYDKERSSARSYPERDVLDKRPVDELPSRRVDELPSRRVDELPSRRVDELPSRRVDDDRIDDRVYSRDRRIYDRDRDDSSRRRYDDDDRYYDRSRKIDEDDIRVRDRDRLDTTRSRPDRVYDRDIEDRYRDERSRRRPSDDRSSDSDDDRYRRRYDDERYVIRKGDDGRDDRYRSSDSDYRREDSYRDRSTDVRDTDRFRDKLPADDEYRRRDDRYRNSEEDRYRSRTDSEVPARRLDDVRPRGDEERYRGSDAESNKPRLKGTEEDVNRRRDIDTSERRDRTPYRDDIRSTAVSKPPISDSTIYRSRDSVRDRDEDYRTRDSVLPSRREERRDDSDRSRTRDDSRYDDYDRRRTRRRDERYDDRDDKYRRDPLPRRVIDEDDYEDSRSPVSKGDYRALDRDRPVYLVEDKELSKSLDSKPDDRVSDRRPYLVTDDEYVRNPPKTDVKLRDDDYRPPRRLSDDTKKIDERYEDRRRDRPDYKEDRDRSKGEYIRDRDRDRRRDRDDYDRGYSPRDSRYDDPHPADRNVGLREDRVDERPRERIIRPSKALSEDSSSRSSELRESSSDSYKTESRYNDDEYRRPPRRFADDDHPRRDSSSRDNTRIYSSRDENQSNAREKRYEGTRKPCPNRKNSFTDESKALSFRRVGDDDCDDSPDVRDMSSSAPIPVRNYDDRKSSSPRPLTPKEIIDEAYRHMEGDGKSRDAVYPVYDPRVINMTSPEIIRPNERRGTIITAKRRKRRSLSRKRK